MAVNDRVIEGARGALEASDVIWVTREPAGTVVRQADIPTAGKTGTSSATMDTAFVAYTSRWITTIWMGDDMRVRPLGRDDAAYMTAEPRWAPRCPEAKCPAFSQGAALPSAIAGNPGRAHRCLHTNDILRAETQSSLARTAALRAETHFCPK